MSRVSQELAQFIRDARFEQLSPRAIEMTKRCLVDAIGVSLAASGLGEGVRPFIELVATQGGRPACTVLGTGMRGPPEAAAFANGAFAHALDYEDSHDRALVHPNAAAIPAALAIAEAFGPVGTRCTRSRRNRRSASLRQHWRWSTSATSNPISCACSVDVERRIFASASPLVCPRLVVAVNDH